MIDLVRQYYHQRVPLGERVRFAYLRRRAMMYAARAAMGLVDPQVRDLESRLRRLKGAYAGERCFIMGNGPSLNEMDLDLFRGEQVWGSNRCYLLFDRIVWRPSFYVAVDRRVVPDNADEIASLATRLEETSFFFPFHYRVRGTLPSLANLHWYHEERHEGAEELPWSLFSTDVPTWVSAVYTVTVAALQLAVYMGFDPIYLIGCDTSYGTRRSTTTTEGDPDALIATADDDADHFDPDYFGAGKRFHEPHVDRMIFHYKQCKRACDELGVGVYNATVGGRLEVFPRVDHRELF